MIQSVVILKIARDKWTASLVFDEKSKDEMISATSRPSIYKKIERIVKEKEPQ